MKERDYQLAAIDSIFDYFQSNEKGNPVIGLPPGTGKSVVISGLIKRIMGLYPNQRIIMATHVKELINQNLDKLLTMWPTAPAGVYSAGLGKKDATFPITYGGIASMVKQTSLFGHIDLLIIDEAHLVSPKNGTIYQRFLSGLMLINANIRVIGLTATAYRMRQGSITEGGLFTDFSFNATTKDSFNWFFDEGYLCRLIPKRPRIALNVDGVSIRGNEYVARELQAAVDKDDITLKALEELLEVGSDRNHCLIFAAGITHAENIVEALCSLGVNAAAIHSKMPTKQRDLAIKRFETGEYWALVNNGVLTTGYDYPEIDLLGIFRPTLSPGLWVQILGRGIRTSYGPGHDLSTKDGRLDAIAESRKPNCLVMDFAGNSRLLGPINDPVIPSKPGKKKIGPVQAPLKVCEECGTYNHITLRYCVECGEIFPTITKIEPTASTLALIANEENEVVSEIFDVTRVLYVAHTKKGRPDSIKVTYYCGLRIFHEYLCFDHSQYPARKAKLWWLARNKPEDGGDYLTIPRTTNEALLAIEKLKTPHSIIVQINKKYPEILDYDFE